MHREFAIECKCSHRRERFQLAFARKALEVLPRNEATRFEPGADGLTVLAETELALERPISRLREVYGEELRIEPPTVRYQPGEQVQEPHMGLRVHSSPECFEALRRDLDLRAARILDAEVTERFAILRASAPLAALVGYPKRVNELTGGRGRLVMWLSHYAPVEDDPPPGGFAA